jgi:hypothetical protein
LDERGGADAVQSLSMYFQILIVMDQTVINGGRKSNSKMQALCAIQRASTPGLLTSDGMARSWTYAKFGNILKPAISAHVMQLQKLRSWAEHQGMAISRDFDRKFNKLKSVVDYLYGVKTPLFYQAVDLTGNHELSPAPVLPPIRTRRPQMLPHILASPRAQTPLPAIQVRDHSLAALPELNPDIDDKFCGKYVRAIKKQFWNKQGRDVLKYPETTRIDSKNARKRIYTFYNELSRRNVRRMQDGAFTIEAFDYKLCFLRATLMPVFIYSNTLPKPEAFKAFPNPQDLRDALDVYVTTTANLRNKSLKHGRKVSAAYVNLLTTLQTQFPQPSYD